MKSSSNKYELIVIGTSAGGLHALTSILSELPKNYPIPILIVQHRMASNTSMLEDVLQSKCRLKIKQADEKLVIEHGVAYIAPADYHMLVEQNGTISLSCDEKVCYSRPSVDVLFESASFAYREKLLGIILTGANADGSMGVRSIRYHGGSTIVQEPSEAPYSMMPQSAIDIHCVDLVMPLQEIALYLKRLGGEI